MVVNLPDIGALPETRLLAEKNEDRQIIRKARYRTKWFNQKLMRAVKMIERKTNIDMVNFDLFQFMKNLSKEFEALGFINYQDACLNTELLEFHPDCGNGINFKKFIYFDQVHLSSHSHKRLGRSLYSFLPVRSTTE